MEEDEAEFDFLFKEVEVKFGCGLFLVFELFPLRQDALLSEEFGLFKDEVST